LTSFSCKCNEICRVGYERYMVTHKDVWKLYDISAILIQMGKGVSTVILVPQWSNGHRGMLK